MNPKVDFYFNKTEKWTAALAQLRTIVLDCGLTEVLKWGTPCYMFGKSNIVLIHTFKEYCALLFFKGALMKDHHGILVQQTENVQSARQIRFTNVQEIQAAVSIIKAYIFEACEIEEAGLKVVFKEKAAYTVPEEFERKLSEAGGETLKAAFEALTPGRQKGYLLHFSAPKQSKTRESRIEKCIPMILDGKGLND